VHKMTIQKSFFLLNFIMFLPWRHRCCLKADLLEQRHLTAIPSNRMLMSLSHCLQSGPLFSVRSLEATAPRALPRKQLFFLQSIPHNFREGIHKNVLSLQKNLQLFQHCTVSRAHFPHIFAKYTSQQ
jgi:hypothetical protein